MQSSSVRALVVRSGIAVLISGGALVVACEPEPVGRFAGEPTVQTDSGSVVPCSPASDDAGEGGAPALDCGTTTTATVRGQINVTTGAVSDTDTLSSFTRFEAAFLDTKSVCPTAPIGSDCVLTTCSSGYLDSGLATSTGTFPNVGAITIVGPSRKEPLEVDQRGVYLPVEKTGLGLFWSGVQPVHVTAPGAGSLLTIDSRLQGPPALLLTAPALAKDGAITIVKNAELPITWQTVSTTRVEVLIAPQTGGRLLRCSFLSNASLAATVKVSALQALPNGNADMMIASVTEETSARTDMSLSVRLRRVATQGGNIFRTSRAVLQ